MKQREFDALRGPEAVRFSGGQFRLAVESLDNPRRDTAQGEKPVEDQVPMTPQALRDLLHRREPAPHGLSAPGIEELPRPSRGCILPEPLELFAQQVSPNALEVVLQQLGKPGGLVVREVLRSLEQTPAGLRERWLVAVPAQLSDLLPPHLVDRHVHVPHDVEAPSEIRSPSSC